MDRPVHLAYARRHFLFRIDSRGCYRFWRVECRGREWRAPVFVTGTEKPRFFRALARAAILHHGL
jgi:hypothetical protein